jgi:hypothetical protein
MKLSTKLPMIAGTQACYMPESAAHTLGVTTRDRRLNPTAREWETTNQIAYMLRHTEHPRSERLNCMIHDENTELMAGCMKA